MDEERELICGINSMRSAVALGQAFGDLSGLSLGPFLLKGVDPFDGEEAADLWAVMLDGLPASSRCNPGFPR